MKEMIGLLWGICLVSIAIYLHITQKLNKGSISIIFAVAILGGIAISNYNFVKKFKGFGMEVETVRKEIDAVKDSAISEIKNEIDEQKASIKMLIRTGNDLNDKLEKQKTIVNAMLEKTSSLEQSLKEDEVKLEQV